MTKDVWTNILQQVRTISNPIFATVNPPAAEEEIHRLERTLQVALPTAFRDYLSTMNGQHDQVPFIGYNYFLSIPDIIGTWSMMNQLFEDEEQVDWVNEDRIKPVIWSNKWIPFTDFEASSRLILDLDPGKNGIPGQIFKYMPGMSYQDVIANSFEEFSNEMLKRFQANQFSFVDDVIAFDDLYFV
ncbi:Cell wall assembly regulator SMI1 [Paenibacillus algorifonticola]|uniref:Cell wall assembly regulator SMI1 n=1 Tax=Paenibacillus algorifonticola TaxID=684063 RepID=A0A1I2ITV2_9BACL|nr:SMI1/KNR4 family protein [Paenibacillus algorifonticola]SFF45724.1 Cell wall assembly regulator SMI1 [Paenibacillus algorifonticola]